MLYICYSVYVVYGHENQVDFSNNEYFLLQAWVHQIVCLPGFHPMMIVILLGMVFIAKK